MTFNLRITSSCIFTEVKGEGGVTAPLTKSSTDVSYVYMVYLMVIVIW